MDIDLEINAGGSLVSDKKSNKKCQWDVEIH